MEGPVRHLDVEIDADFVELLAKVERRMWTVHQLLHHQAVLEPQDDDVEVRIDAADYARSDAGANG